MKIRYPVEYDRQLQQFLDSWLRVYGVEPPAQEIAAFEARQYIYSRGEGAPIPTPSPEARAAVSRASTLLPIET